MTEPRTFDLQPEEELRFEADSTTDLTIKLVQGRAEIFGAEVLPNKAYKFRAAKAALFTWDGAKVEVAGSSSALYVANETPMPTYMKVHKTLHQLRDAALASKAQGPRVLIAGPTDVGKSTLVRLLCSYAARQRWMPTYVDLDVGQGEITAPGSVAAAPVRHADAEDGLTLGAPLAYYYGHASVDENFSLYKHLISALSDRIRQYVHRVPEVNAAGVIINTCGYVENTGYQALLHAAQAFSVDTVLVLGHERLFAQLREHFTGNPVQVIKLSKSGGVVERTPVYRRRARSQRIRQYFYGEDGTLSPHEIVVSYSDVTVYRIGSGPLAPESCLPIGMENTQDPLEISKVPPSAELDNCILSVSYATSKEEVLNANVAGFVFCRGVDVTKQKIRLLSPSPGMLPTKSLVLGTIRWLEE